MNMKREPERFGWTAPAAPKIPALPKVPMDLDFLVKSDTSPETDEPGDPVWSFIKAQADELAKSASTVTDAQVTNLICAPADIRGPVMLRKDASPAADWSWSTPISTDTPMSKRASPAKERFRRQLEEFFPNHDEETISDICAAAAKVSALLAEEAA